VLVDLVYSTPIILRASEFRNLGIKNWSRNISLSKSKNITQIIEAKISYDINLKQMKELFDYTIDIMLQDIKDTEYEKYFPSNLK
jgi:hypothetical protein